MRGEFIGVWSETWREIWQPLSEHEAATPDMFCQLYAELGSLRRPPSHDEVRSLILGDDTLTKDAFERAIVLCGTEIDVDRRDLEFYAAVAFSVGVEQRNERIEGTLAQVTGDQPRSKQAWDEALAAIINDHARVVGLLEKSLANVVNDVEKSQEAFERTRSEHLSGERSVVTFLESAHAVLYESGGDVLANYFFNLLDSFIKKFSLRYDLRRPCLLCPTLPGVFASLLRELDVLAGNHANIERRMRDFEEAVRDLRYGQTEGRIANCVAKQIMLLEAIGSTTPGVTGTELAAICKELVTWPHPALKASLLGLYGFASDFPGIRHGTESRGMLRGIEMRDLVAMSIMLAGFTPYLTDRLDADMIYRGV